MLKGMYRNIQTQLSRETTEHSEFQAINLKVWAGVSSGYCTDLHILKRGTVRVVLYPDKRLDSFGIYFTAQLVLLSFY